jgi:hypothetical protein
MFPLNNTAGNEEKEQYISIENLVKSHYKDLQQNPEYENANSKRFFISEVQGRLDRLLESKTSFKSKSVLEFSRSNSVNPFQAMKSSFLGIARNEKEETTLPIATIHSLFSYFQNVRTGYFQDPLFNILSNIARIIVTSNAGTKMFSYLITGQSTNERHSAINTLAEIFNLSKDVSAQWFLNEKQCTSYEVRYCRTFNSDG